jgi:hypothetical protein
LGIFYFQCNHGYRAQPIILWSFRPKDWGKQLFLFLDYCANVNIFSILYFLWFREFWIITLTNAFKEKSEKHDFILSCYIRMFILTSLPNFKLLSFEHKCFFHLNLDHQPFSSHASHVCNLRCCIYLYQFSAQFKPIERYRCSSCCSIPARAGRDSHRSSNERIRSIWRLPSCLVRRVGCNNQLILEFLLLCVAAPPRSGWLFSKPRSHWSWLRQSPTRIKHRWTLTCQPQ